MADGFSYNGVSGAPYPFWRSSPPPYPSASPSPYLATQPVYFTQGVFDPMMSHRSYHRSPTDWSNNSSCGEPSLNQNPSSSFYADNTRPGNLGPRGEVSYKDMFSPSGYYQSSSSDYVPLPTDYLLERQRLDRMPYKFSAPVSHVDSSAAVSDMLIRYSQEPFYNPILSSGNAFDEKRPGQCHPGYEKPLEGMNAVSGPHVEPCLRVPVLPVSSLKTEARFDGSKTGACLGDGRLVPDVVSSHAPEIVQSTFHGSSVEPVNFNALLGYGEATGHVKPFSENPDLRNETVGSIGSRSPHCDSKSSNQSKEKREGSGVSTLYHTPKTLLADSENGASETSLKNAIDDLNCDEHRSWNHFMVSSQIPSAPTVFSKGSESCVAVKADNENAAQSAGNGNQPGEDVQASEKTCKLQQQMFDDVSTGQTPERHLCNKGVSSPRVSSVVNTMQNLSEVLVYECFNNATWLKPEQLESLDKVVENLTKCLKKITGNKTIAEEASIATQAMHVSSPNVADLNEASNVVAKDFQGFNDKPLASFGLKESVDKDKNENENDMTQSIKNILASNFPDGEENNPQTLLYKSLWLETEAALCSTTCMARYRRIKNEIDNLELQNREISADASTFMQEPFVNRVIAPQSSRFNSDSVDSVLLGLMSRSFMEEEYHGNFKPDATTSASTTEEKRNDVIDRFQILKHQETKRKLKSQNCSKTRTDDQEENPEVANIDRSSQMSDVMDRFKMLKRRDAERVQKSLNSLDVDSDSDKDQPRNTTQICDHIWSDSMMTTGGNSLIETTCANAEEPSASGEGYESPTSDWEHVRKDN